VGQISGEQEKHLPQRAQRSQRQGRAEKESPLLHKIEQLTMLIHPRKLSWTDLSAQSMQKSAVTVSFWDWLA